MTTPISDLIVAILGAAGGTGAIVVALVTWLGKTWADRLLEVQKQVLQTAANIDLDLRERRIKVYQEIWTATELLPKWPRNENATYEDLMKLSESFRDWYFRTGGMYLSRTTHDSAYSPLQDAIAELRDKKVTGKISPQDYEYVRKRCSALRTALANDVESRREGPI